MELLWLMPRGQQNHFLYLLPQIGPGVETLTEDTCVEAACPEILPSMRTLCEMEGSLPIR